jgi:3-phenylpropionate/cinnamic acid dioxygenase small subunit
VTALTHAEAAALLAREAMLLDRLDFDPWLDLYTVDCLFWMPPGAMTAPRPRIPIANCR